MPRNTPSQAEGERPDDDPASETQQPDAQPGPTTPSQAEGEREPDGDDDTAA